MWKWMTNVWIVVWNDSNVRKILLCDDNEENDYYWCIPTNYWRDIIINGPIEDIINVLMWY